MQTEVSVLFNSPVVYSGVLRFLLIVPKLLKCTLMGCVEVCKSHTEADSNALLMSCCGLNTAFITLQMLSYCCYVALERKPCLLLGQLIPNVKFNWCHAGMERGFLRSLNLK